MKPLAIAAASLVATLALSSVALAGGTVPGRYTTTIKSPAQFKGTWVLTFGKGGAYTVAGNGLLIRGKYSTTGSKITFGHETGDGACEDRQDAQVHPRERVAPLQRTLGSPRAHIHAAVLMTRRGPA